MIKIEDYICPTCGMKTSKYCTRLKCDCHIKENRIVDFGGILHFKPTEHKRNQTINDLKKT